MKGKASKIILVILIILVMLSVFVAGTIIAMPVLKKKDVTVAKDQTEKIKHSYANEDTSSSDSQEITRNYEIKSEETWDVSKNQDGSVMAKWTLSDKTIRISGSGEMKDWKSSDNSEWKNKNYKNIIREVIIQDGVTNVGQYAFYECNGILKVELTDSVLDIGTGAFWRCKELEAITIPGSVTKIGSISFYECTSLKNLIISEGVTTIGDRAFEGCSSLKEIKIPASVTSLETWDRLFYGCNSLEKIVVDENNPKFMSEDGVLYNKNKTSLLRYPNQKKDYKYSIPDGVKNVAFDEEFEANNLKELDIPSSFTGTTTGSLYIKNNNLENIVVDKDNPNYTSEDGILFDKNKTTIINYPSNKSDFKQYVIPSTVTSIKAYAFSNCSYLKSIVISNTIKDFSSIHISTDLILYVETNSVAHKWAEENKHMYILTGNNTEENNEITRNYEIKKEETWDVSRWQDGTVIAKWTFDNRTLTITGNEEMKAWSSSSGSIWYHGIYKTLIENVIVEDGVWGIASGAFNGCTNISKIEIPDSAKYIGYRAFYGCSSLSSINIPANVTYIGESAFKGCGQLNYIKVAEDSEKYVSEDGVLFDKNKTELVCYPSNKIDVNEYSIPNTVIEIRESAFYRCTSLVKIEIPKTVTAIGFSAFEGCENLESINIPNSIQMIENATFKYCRKLNEIVIPESVTSIGWNAFEGCLSIKDVLIPDSVVEIYNYAFENCSNLVNVEISNSINRIGYGSFNGCNKIDNFIIPNSEVEMSSETVPESAITYTKANSKLHSILEESQRAYIIDEEAPIVILEPNGTEEIKREHSVNVVVRDNQELVGVNVASLKYQWTQSIEQPSKDSFKEIFVNGQTITKNTGDGKWYLWIYAKDRVGNETITRSEAFEFDNTVSITKVEYEIKVIGDKRVGTATIKSEEQLQEIDWWTLSEDKLTLSKNYEKDTIENVAVKDLLGNAKVVNIKMTGIDLEAPKFDLQNYPIKDQYIVKIKPNTTYNEFIKNIQTNQTYTVKEGSKVISGTDIIKTGQILTTQMGEQYTLVVLGDLNGDGKISLVELARISKIGSGKIKDYKEIEKMAIDANADGNINILDMAAISKLAVEK